MIYAWSKIKIYFVLIWIKIILIRSKAMLRRYSTTIRRSEYVLDFLINVLILGVLIKSSKYFELNLHTIFSFAVLFVVGQILIFRVLGLYGSRRFRSLLQQLVLITTSILIHAVLVSVFYAGARFFLDFSLISYIKLLMTYYLVLQFYL